MNHTTPPPPPPRAGHPRKMLPGAAGEPCGVRDVLPGGGIPVRSREDSGAHGTCRAQARPAACPGGLWGWGAGPPPRFRVVVGRVVREVYSTTWEVYRPRGLFSVLLTLTLPSLPPSPLCRRQSTVESGVTVTINHPDPVSATVRVGARPFPVLEAFVSNSASQHFASCLSPSLPVPE